MQNKSIRGSLVALITPFTKDGSIDYKAYEALLKLHTESKTDGLVICGTTGEAATLTLDEKKSLLKTAKDFTKGKIPIIFGTGGNDTKSVVSLTKDAASYGADAVLVVTPYYNKPPQAGLIAHYKAVAASTKLPVILYNVPGRTGCNMLPETVLELAKTKNIVAVKEASGNLEQAMKIISKAPKGFGLFSGEDALNLPIMACGAIGTISVTANVAPKMMKKFNDVALKNDWETAKKIHYKLLELHRGLFTETNPLPAKAALMLKKLISEHTRLPLSSPSQSTIELMSKLIKDME